MAKSRRYFCDMVLNSTNVLRISILFAFLFLSTNAWDSSDLELFDLVEEVQQNFYEVLEIRQDASPADIRRAYRRLSLQLHPDKNKEENAEEKFRQLVAISEVLKDEDLRQRYDLILEHGLPDWRQPVFYYRRVRKMGLAELSILLSVILSVGHYLVLWSMYFERKLELEALIKPKREKKNKKSKQMLTSTTTTEQTGTSIEDDPFFVQKPAITDVLPYRLACFTVSAIRNLPETFRQMVENWKARRKTEDDVSDDEDDDVKEARRKEQGPREKQRIDPAMYEYDRSSSAAVTMATVHAGGGGDEGDEKTAGSGHSAKSQGIHTWTATEESSLVKAMTKFPGGTPDRWTKIAAEVRKPVEAVTKKVKQLKSQQFATNVDAAAQGITGAIQGSVISKKTGCGLTDDITTHSANQEELHDSENKRHRSAKPIKTKERTVMISQQVDGDNQNGITGQDINLSSREEQDKEIDELVHSGIESCAWTQRQQKILEKAMQIHPRGVDGRWDKIAESVPGKTKDECIARYKELVEVVKRRKQNTAQR